MWIVVVLHILIQSTLHDFNSMFNMDLCGTIALIQSKVHHTT